jgi:hypothetical protein
MMELFLGILGTTIQRERQCETVNGKDTVGSLSAKRENDITFIPIKLGYLGGRVV